MLEFLGFHFVSKHSMKYHRISLSQRKTKGAVFEMRNQCCAAICAETSLKAVAQTNCKLIDLSLKDKPSQFLNEAHNRALNDCRQMVSGSISLRSLRFFSPFPHGTGSLSVRE